MDIVRLINDLPSINDGTVKLYLDGIIRFV
jgi:hypothetical protein